MGGSKRSWPAALMIGLLLLVAIVSWFKTRHSGEARELFETHPKRVMGTSCLLRVVGKVGDEQRSLGEALRDAERALRRVESLMSTWIDSSELSRFNKGPAGVAHQLSSDTLRVLHAAKALHRASAGTFDVTCRPQIELWRRQGRAGRLPTPQQLQRARLASSWSLITLEAAAARKTRASARFDLGGIAKGYGIDLAIEAMRAKGIAGGLVDVGGDLRFFGTPLRGLRWSVDIRDPFAKGQAVVATLVLEEGAVATSGDYARYVEIEGRRFSHVLDPRSGFPASHSPSVTVVAATAMLADAWATALSVLGPAGIGCLPVAIEAMVVTRTSPPRAFVSPGFQSLLAQAPPFPLIERPRLGRCTPKQKIYDILSAASGIR